MFNNTVTNSYSNNIGYNLVIFSSLLSIFIAKELSVDDQNILAALLQSIGDNLSILSNVQGIYKEKNQDTS